MQSINIKSHIFNVRGDNDKTKQTPTRILTVIQRSLKKETSTLGEIVSLNYIMSNKNVIGPKDSEEDYGMKPTEVDVSGASDKDEEDDQATRKENKSQRLSELLICLFSLSNGTQESDSRSERSKMDRSNARGASTISTSEDLQFPDKVYKVEKALYGLHQAPRAWFQVTPKTSHLHVVNRIFRYLKGQPKLGLWYPKDSPFDLEAFSDSDYAGASLDRKSTIGGCQFLGKRLISWCYGFNFMNTKIYIDNKSTICVVKNPVFHSKTKHIDIRHYFIKDSYEKRLILGRLMVYKCSGLYTNAIWIKVGSGSPNKVGDEAINEEMPDSVERAVTTATSLETEQASGNIHKTQFTVTLNEPFSLELGSGGHTLGSGEDNMEHQIELKDNVPNTPHDSPLLGVNTPGSDEGRLKLEELMVMCTKLSKQVLDLEKEKDAQAVEILKLKKRVKKLERQRKSSISNLRRRIYRQVKSSDDDLDEEDASKQGRTSDKTKPIFKNMVKGSGDTEAVNIAGEGVSTANVYETVSTAAPKTPPTTTIVFDDEDVTIAMAQTLIKMKEEKAKEKGVAIKDVEDSSRPIRSITTLQPLPTIDPKYKGDAQIERDAEVALRLQAELDEELRVERERQKEASKVAIAKMCDEVQARIDADYELAAKMTQEVYN
ncbi:hypothetical protein Tco_1402182 [Tanacetum coccineum]